jgi:hypothetical protein
MPDEDDAPTTDVVVVTPTEDDTPDVETGDTTVIVETPTESPTESPTPETIGNDPLTERLVNLERDVAEIREAVFTAQLAADTADRRAERALEETEQLAENDEHVLDAVDETVEAGIESAEIVEGDDGEEVLEVDEDMPPASARVHPLFRPARDWFGR